MSTTPTPRRPEKKPFAPGVPAENWRKAISAHRPYMAVGNSPILPGKRADFYAVSKHANLCTFVVDSRFEGSKAPGVGIGMPRALCVDPRASQAPAKHSSWRWENRCATTATMSNQVRTHTSRLSSEEKAIFLASLSRTGNVAASCRLINRNRRTMYLQRDRDPEFAVEWEDALETAMDDLEGEAWRRAKDGVRKQLFHQGAPVYESRLVKQEDGTTVAELVLDENGQAIPVYEYTYSDGLMAKLLAAHRPAFRDSSKVELTGANGGPVAFSGEGNDLARRIAFVIGQGLRAHETAREQVPDDGSDLV